MKKILICTALLLSFVLASASCTFGGDDIPVWTSGSETSGTTTDPSDTGEAPALPSDPADLIGKWYSEAGATAMQFFTDNTVKVFRLTPGYYEYSEVLDGTYTYDGLTLTYTLTDESKLNAPCSVSPAGMTVSDRQKLQFLPVDTLPEQHATYTFPDYRELAKKNALPDGNYTGNSLHNELRNEALKSVAAQFCQNKTDDSLKQLNEGTVKSGDLVSIDYTGYLNGEAFQGGTAKGAHVQAAPDTGFIPGFAEGIVGHSVGETFDVNVTFPENYGSADLAGKAVVFTMTINCIYDPTEWAEKEAASLLRDIVWDLIPGLTDAEIPEEAYLFFLQINLDQLHYLAYAYGYSYEAVLAMLRTTEEEIRTDCIRIARIYLQAEQLAAKWNLTPDEEYTAKIKEQYIADLKEEGLSAEEAENYIAEDGKNSFRAYLMTEFITDYLIENNTFTEKEPE